MATLDSSIYKDIPIGDKIRNVNFTALVAATDTTIVNVASGGGVLHSLIFTQNLTSDFTLNSIKVTVDGAAERTLTFNGDSFYFANGGATGYGFPFQLNIPIPFTTSLTVKVNVSNDTNVPECAAIYTIR